MKHPFRGNRVTINSLPVRGGWKPDIRINSSHASLNQGRRHKNHVFNTKAEAIAEGEVCAESIINDVPPVVNLFPRKKKKKKKPQE